MGGDQITRLEPSWIELVPLQKRPQRDPHKDTVRRWLAKNQEADSHH